jgi:hypothetical protein
MRMRDLKVSPAGAALVLIASAAGCAPAIASMSMPNPARSPTSVAATQSYDIPPFAEDHRYEATLAGWTPSAVAFRIHLVNAESCGFPASYTFDLVDDHGRRYPFQPSAAPKVTASRGHMGAALNDATVDGTFAATVDATTRYVLLQVRPRDDRACTALDFRWDFQT